MASKDIEMTDQLPKGRPLQTGEPFNFSSSKRTTKSANTSGTNNLARQKIACVIPSSPTYTQGNKWTLSAGSSYLQNWLEEQQALAYSNPDQSGSILRSTSETSRSPASILGGNFDGSSYNHISVSKRGASPAPKFLGHEDYQTPLDLADTTFSPSFKLAPGQGFHINNSSSNTVATINPQNLHLKQDLNYVVNNSSFLVVLPSNQLTQEQDLAVLGDILLICVNTSKAAENPRLLEKHSAGILALDQPSTY